MVLNNKEFIQDVKGTKKHIPNNSRTTCYVYSEEECDYFQVYDIQIENGEIIIESD